MQQSLPNGLTGPPPRTAGPDCWVLEGHLLGQEAPSALTDSCQPLLGHGGTNPDPTWAEQMTSGAPQETPPQVPAPLTPLATSWGLHPKAPLLNQRTDRRTPAGAATRQSPQGVTQQKGKRPEAPGEAAAASILAVKTSRATGSERRHTDGPRHGPRLPSRPAGKARRGRCPVVPGPAEGPLRISRSPVRWCHSASLSGLD